MIKCVMGKHSRVSKTARSNTKVKKRIMYQLCTNKMKSLYALNAKENQNHQAEQRNRTERFVHIRRKLDYTFAGDDIRGEERGDSGRQFQCKLQRRERMEAKDEAATVLLMRKV